MRIGPNMYKMISQRPTETSRSLSGVCRLRSIEIPRGGAQLWNAPNGLPESGIYPQNMTEMSVNNAHTRETGGARWDEKSILTLGNKADDLEIVTQQ